MRNDILFGILITLLKEGKCSYRYLAEKFEVCKKTIQRYMLTLEMSGVPTISYPGRNGGNEIASSFGLPNMFFTTQELSRLHTHLKASPLSSLDNIDKQIKEKLEYKILGSNDELPNNYIIDYNGWDTKQPSNPILKILAEAIDSKSCFEINYQKSNGENSFRTISPYKLVYKDFKWYLFAYCHSRKDYRLFKVNRLLEVNPCESEFHPLAISNDEIKNYLDNRFKEVDIKLIAEPSILPDISEHIKIKSTQDLEDKLLIEGTAMQSDSLSEFVLGFCGKLTLVSPQTEVDKIKQKCKILYANYLA